MVSKKWREERQQKLEEDSWVSKSQCTDDRLLVILH
jgi:hypothetical protein